MITNISLVAVFVGLLIFAMWKDVRPFFQPQYMFAVIINPDRTRAVYWAKPKDGVFSLKHDKQSYKFTPNTVYKTGRFKVGTAYFIRGKAPSINFDTMALEDAALASEFYVLKNNRVAEQIVATLDNSTVSMTTVMAIICVAIIGSVGFLYWKWNPRLEAIEEQTAPTVTKSVPDKSATSYEYR